MDTYLSPAKDHRHVASAPHEADIALARCQLQWQTAFANPLIGFGLCDLDRRLLEGNQALERLVGRTTSELREAPVPIATHPDDREQSIIAFRAISTGQQERETLTKRYVHRDGTIIWCQVLLALIRDPDAKPHRVLITLIDITEQKRATQALQAHLLGLTKMELAILTLLANPQLRTYSQIGARLFRSGETIRKHAQHIASKLGLPSASRADIVASAKERGLLDLPVSDHPLDGG